MEANVGLGFVIDRVGFLSMQYEWTGLNEARYFFGNVFGDWVGRLITTLMKVPQYLCTLGGVELAQDAEVRAGAHATSSPLLVKNSTACLKYGISGGFGVVGKNGIGFSYVQNRSGWYATTTSGRHASGPFRTYTTLCRVTLGVRLQ